MTKLLSSLVVALMAAQAEPPLLKTFASAEDAAIAAIEAAGKNDIAALDEIFGPNSKAILTSGDPKQDQEERAQFARIASGKHHLEKDPMNPHRMILDVGPEDWPFPVPIVEKNGKWSFEPSQGQLEVRVRRIGANELDAMEICAGYVEAQHEYVKVDHDKDGLLEYAEYIMSSTGKQDGLYFEGAGTPLVPKTFAEAEVRPGHPKPKPYHGYYFHVLTAQGPNAKGGAHEYVVKGAHMMGGFALVAWPAEYGVMGIRTFIVNQDGVVYERDLGRPASNLTPPVKIFDPDKSWRAVE
jgi:hypothetical protein